jgi:ABC-type uncharacterized transport system substrate-binding protein
LNEAAGVHDAHGRRRGWPVSCGTRAAARPDAADRSANGFSRKRLAGAGLYRSIPGDAESRQRFAKELVALQPDLILSHTTTSTAALLQETRTIPIIFATVTDPVGSGFVPSLARPGGNVTGFTLVEPTMAAKWVELLKEIAPRVNRVAMLFNPTTASYADYFLKPFKAAAPSFAVAAIAAPVRDMSELESAISAQAHEPNGGLIVMPDSFTDTHREDIISLVARYRLPAVYAYRFFSERGGLLSYGAA